MREKEMEDLLWEYPEKFLNEPLTKFRRQPSSAVGRADLVFTDRMDYLIVVEVKLGTLPRGAVGQLDDYLGMLKSEFPRRPVELMAVANHIPKERRLSCDHHDIDAREISEKQFRDVAEEVGYEFQSEKTTVGALDHDSENREGIPTTSARLNTSLGEEYSQAPKKAWYYWEDDSHGYILAFVNQFGSCSMRKWNSDTGYSADRKATTLDGSFQQKFAAYLKSGMALYISKQPNLERDCKERLPDRVLAELAPQIREYQTSQQAKLPNGASVSSAERASSGSMFPLRHGDAAISGSSIGPAKVEKAWHYWEEGGIGYILAFVNQHHSCSMRKWNADTGYPGYPALTRAGGADYQQRFSDHLKSGMGLRLTKQPSLETECKQRLASWVLDELGPQIRRFRAARPSPPARPTT